MKGTRIIASRFGWLGIVFLVLAALSSAVLADADPAPSAPPVEHLLLVPETPDAVVALTNSDARVVARYQSFALVEAAGDDDRRLRAAGAQLRDDMREVTTAAGPVDPAVDRGSLAGKQAPDRGEVLALVQFVGPPKDAWVDRLRDTGATIVTYQAENAYVVHASGAAVDRIAALVGTDAAVRAVIPVGAVDKLVGPTDAGGRYAVTTVAGGAGQGARDQASAEGPAVGAPTTIGARRVQYLELSPAQVDELARDPGVVTIERDLAPRPFDERASQILAGNLNGFHPSAPGYLSWYDLHFPGSFDQTIDFTDTGLDNGASPTTHPDFHADGVGANPDRIVYGTDYTGPPPSGPDLDVDATDCTGHGTNVTSIAAGYNDGADQESGFHYGLGVAPEARIGVSKVFQGCSNYDGPDPGTDPDHAFSLGAATVGSVASSAYLAGARVTNNSWGTSDVSELGRYSTRAAEYDQLVRDARSGHGRQPGDDRGVRGRQ